MVAFPTCNQICLLEQWLAGTELGVVDGVEVATMSLLVVEAGVEVEVEVEVETRGLLVVEAGVEVQVEVATRRLLVVEAGVAMGALVAAGGTRSTTRARNEPGAMMTIAMPTIT